MLSAAHVHVPATAEAPTAAEIDKLIALTSALTQRVAGGGGFLLMAAALLSFVVKQCEHERTTNRGD
jgi:hypothetical protein